MYCDQCSMSLPGGCRIRGVCGKDETLQSLQEALIYGLKGTAAYYYHALEHGYRDNEIEEFITTALYSTLTNVNFDKNDFLKKILEAGRIHFKTMELLDKAYVETYGKPEVTEVNVGLKRGHGILVTGHSYKAIYELLRQIKEMGLEGEINVYTHSEMLPAHSYPRIKSFKSLAGNYGGSWVYQVKEFAQFPGIILGTSNCVVPPLPAYKDRMYTVSVAKLEGVKHVENFDYTQLIEHALKTKKIEEERVEGKVLTGFHHTNVLPILDNLVDMIDKGKVKRVVVVAGCDAPHGNMSYYEKLVRSLPNDVLIITAACLKFRFNRYDLGKIDGIPRLLDFGQCNNVYSILVVARELIKKLGTRKPPVSLVVSWMEQKAVGILYTLLYLGLRNLYLGPKMPEFLSDEVKQILAKEFKIRPIGSPEEDVKKILQEGVEIAEDSPLAEVL